MLTNRFLEHRNIHEYITYVFKIDAYIHSMYYIPKHTDSQFDFFKSSPSTIPRPEEKRKIEKIDKPIWSLFLPIDSIK